MTVALIGCAKKKRTLNPFEPMILARELYCSDLFKKRVEHVESRSLPGYILSAKSGCVAPSTPMRIYDHTMSDKIDQIDVSAWHVGVVNQLIDLLYYEQNIRDLRTVSVEIHAGRSYCDPLKSILELVGFEVFTPVAGLGIGEQLGYYSKTVEKGCGA
jgi:hypothetical protein